MINVFILKAVCADQFLMVMGGYDAVTLDNVELVSLRSDVPVPPCLLDVGPLPEARHRAAGGLLGPGRIKFRNRAKVSPNRYARRSKFLRRPAPRPRYQRHLPPGVLRVRLSARPVAGLQRSTRRTPFGFSVGIRRRLGTRHGRLEMNSLHIQKNSKEHHL